MMNTSAVRGKTGGGREDLERRLWTLEETNRALRDSFRDLTALQDLTRALSEAHDLEAVLDVLVELMGRILEPTLCVPLLWDNVARRWHPGRPTDRERPLNPALCLHLREGMVDWVAENRRPTVVPSEGGPAPESHILVPMLSGGETIGLVHLTALLDQSQVSRHHMDMLMLLANQAGSAIQNLRLHQHTRELKDYFHNCLESLSTAVMVLDRESRITIVNREAAELLNLNHEDTAGRSYRQVFPDRVLPVIDHIVTETLLSRRVSEREFEFPIAATGKALPVAISASHLKDSKGNLLGVILLFRDLTMTREIDHLRRLDHLKNEFVSNVSHELRTPLTSIKAYTESLMDSVDESDAQTRLEFLRIINEECDRLGRLISDLLDLSRIERGKFELNLQPSDLSAIVRNAVAFLSRASRIHQFITCIDPELAPIPLDPDKILQALTNLIGNAVKYSPDGGEITIDVYTDKEKVWVAVRDQGIGLSAEDRARVFEKFYRANPQSHPEISGTGLGLSITRYIVEAHGGHIEVESEEGAGSVFRFCLPFSKGNPASCAPE